MFGEVLESFFTFLAANRPFAEVSRLDVVSKTWRRVSANALKTAHELNLSVFAESVTDEVATTSALVTWSTSWRHVAVSRRLT
jgi:hypothetical protein